MGRQVIEANHLDIRMVLAAEDSVVAGCSTQEHQMTR